MVQKLQLKTPKVPTNTAVAASGISLFPAVEDHDHGISASSLPGGAAVTAASTKITLAGSPSVAGLAAFSIDVNQANLDHGSIGGLADDDHALYLLASDATSRALFATNWLDLTDLGATTLHKHDHGGMDGLLDDDHTQYRLESANHSHASSGLEGGTLAVGILTGGQSLSPSTGQLVVTGALCLIASETIALNLGAGKSGGDTLAGGTAASEDLTFESTAHATKGNIFFGTKSSYDQVNDRWGFGVLAPDNQIVSTNDLTTANNGASFEQWNSAGQQPGIFFRRGRGTRASPTAILSGDNFGFFQFLGQYDTTVGNQNVGGQMLLSATENFDATHGGSDWTFYITKKGAITVTEVFRITDPGVIQYANNTTGGGTALLGANSPAVTNTAPYTWMKWLSSDGSTVYIPAWK